MKDLRRVQALFEACLELGHEQRSEWLLQEAAGDGQLVRQVENLLAADTDPLDGFSCTPSEFLKAFGDGPPATELCGVRFGAYLIEEHISSGGMGHVYRAVRSTGGTDRRVAVKALRPGLVTSSFLDRFRDERRTLAGLEHENIVSFIDAEELPDGRPCLVMEYIEGVAVTDWVEARSMPERLRMFGLVLNAVQYAHRQLVVHRDLKPSNVLVTRQGSLKLLDFGVATIVGESLDKQQHSSPLTPSYAAPELLRGEAASTSSDIYSLGLLLQEMITGETLTESSRLLPGRALRAIIDHATHPVAAERYESVSLLSEDLRRARQHEPTRAGKTPWINRCGLFLWRNRLAVSIGVAMLFAVGAGWFGSEVGRQRAQRDAGAGWGAHGEAKRASQVFEAWIVDAIEADPELGDSAVLHFEEGLRTRLLECPEADVLVRLRLAELYLSRGALDQAEAHAQKAWAMAQITLGIGNFDRGRSQQLLVDISAARLE